MATRPVVLVTGGAGFIGSHIVARFASTMDVVQEVLDLLLLLHWRSTEIFASEQIATVIGAPHYVLATKHPLSVAHDLVSTDKRPL